MSNADQFHTLAKDSGNRLRSYILSVSSGATGVFFIALTTSGATSYTAAEKGLLLLALLGFVSTVILCLYELRIDAQRFFELAKEHEKKEPDRSWVKNDQYKKLRLCLINISYITLGIAVLTTSIYLILKIFGT